jgi:uncharacterized protein (UPF0261 family)
MDWNPRGQIALIGTLDTRGEEILFLKHCLHKVGADVLVIDAGVLGAPLFPAEVAAPEPAAGDHSTS